jgi:DNA polymerase III delta prime subunit
MKSEDGAEKWNLKYAPRSLSDVIGNAKPIQQLTEWLENFAKATPEPQAPKQQKKMLAVDPDQEESDEEPDVKKKSSSSTASPAVAKKKIVTKAPSTTMIVSGEHGVGKTLSVALLLKKMGYVVKNLNLASISAKVTKRKSALYDQLAGLTGSIDVRDMMGGKASEVKTAVVIDNIDAITGKNEKENLQLVHKMNEKFRLFPLIIISTNKHSKLLAKIEKECKQIKFSQPQFEKMQEHAMRICEKAGMNVKPDAILAIVTNAQYDVRRMVNLLEELYRIHGDREVNQKAAKSFCETIQKKDSNWDLFDATRLLFYDFRGVEESLRLFKSDKVIQPLMMHENYFDILQVRKIGLSIPDEDIFEALEDISESISVGDNTENFIYEEQLWETMPVHGHQSCTYPSYRINRNWRMRPGGENLEYTKDLNRTFIKKINHSHVEVAGPFFADSTIRGYLLAAKITNELINNGDIAGLKRLFADYPGISWRVVEALLKIDKIKTAKGSVKAKRDKQRKVLKQVLSC